MEDFNPGLTLLWHIRSEISSYDIAQINCFLFSYYIIKFSKAPFMTRNLSKEFYTRSRFRNKFCENPTKEWIDLEINFVKTLLKNEKLYKKQRNKCIALRRKCIKEYFHNISGNNIVTNKKFWNFIRPFLINKGSLNSNETMLKKIK